MDNSGIYIEKQKPTQKWLIVLNRFFGKVSGMRQKDE
jgi:hypothetical protein